MSAGTVSVVVPARDAAQLLPGLLDALAAQTRPPDEIVVCDDGSQDDTAAVAQAAGAKVVPGAGEGPGAARNLAGAAATGAVLAFTDADCVPDPGWLAAGLAALEDADLVQGAVRPDAPVGAWDRTIWVLRLSGLFETANLLVRRDVFDRVGGFPAGARPARGKELGEDVLFGWAAARAGARVAFAPDAIVHHAVEPRGPWGYIAERRRLRWFPLLARRAPELRTHFFHRGVFLTTRSMEFDAALAGVGLALAGRRCGALLAVPYARRLARDGRRTAPFRLIADAVGFAALVSGSVRERTLVL